VLFQGDYATSQGPLGGGQRGWGVAYDVSADGQRFLMVKELEQSPAQINVVLNWFEELKRRVPTR
jgi:hypothetical protein